MDSARYARLHRLFGELMSLTETDRENRLQQAAAGDPELAAEVRLLLAAHDEPAPALQGAHDAPSSLAMPVAAALAPAGTPRSIGTYDVEEEIGRGGMGIVYRARQSTPNRTVAIKVLRPGLITAANERRFAQEVQVLGLLDHAGIAKVFDAGSCDVGFGPQPFFVMEFVDGIDLRTACQRASSTDRCRLLARIADAIQHAHEKGIVHRDIKPDNVLVRSPAGANDPGQPKLLDFGIARTEAAPSDGLGTMTGQGALLGTLTYMSPEQLDEGIASPASDIFSLGVVLYEMLTERLPLDLRKLTLSDAIRTAQTQEPVQLSKVDPSLSGDLDVVARTAMAKEPSLRYPSARAFAEDLRRAVRGEPIHARRRTRWYRFQRFAGRNRALTASLLALAAVLLIGSITTLILAANANEEAARAELRGYAGKTLAASAQLRRDPYATEALLGATAEHLRGYEVRVMQAALDTTDRLFPMAPGLPRTCAFSADGHAVAAFADKGVLTIAKVQGGDELRSFRTPSDASALFFSDRADLIGVACGRTDGVARRLVVYDAATANVLFDRSDSPEPVRDLAFSPDGRYLLTRERTENHGLLRVDLKDKRWARIMPPGPDDHAVILDDSSTFCLHLEVHDLATGERLSSSPFRAPFKGIVRWSPSRDVLAGSHPDHRHVYVLAPNQSDSAIKLTSHRGSIGTLQWNDSGRLLMSASQTSGSIRVTEPQTGRLIGDLHANWVGKEPPRLHPDGESVLINTERGVEQLTVRRLSRVLGPHEDYLMAVAWSPDGALIASCDTKARFSVWDADAGERLFVTKSPGKYRDVNVEPASVAFSADGLSLYSVATWTRPMRLDLATGEVEVLDREQLRAEHARSLFGELAPRARLARAWTLSGDGRWLTSAAAPDQNFHWASRPSDLFRRDALGGWQRQPSYANWQRLAAQHRTRPGKAARISQLLRNERREHDLCIAFDWHSERAAVGHPSGEVLVWDLASDRAITTIEAHIGPAMALAWTPDDRLLSAGIDGILTVWDPIAGNRLASFEGHRNAIECIAMSPDGTRFASASEDRTIRLWDTRPAWQRREASERLRQRERSVQARVARQLALGRSQALRAIWTDESLTLPERQAARNLLLRR